MIAPTELLARTRAQALYGSDCFSVCSDLSEAASGFVVGFAEGAQHEKARAMKLVEALEQYKYWHADGTSKVTAGRFNCNGRYVMHETLAEKAIAEYRGEKE